MARIASATNLHGVNRNGRAVLKRRVMRGQLLEVLAQVDPCTIVVEACTGAFWWVRQFEALGHQVKIVSPQYVKPFVRRQKNDGNDAEAICTAARQPNIPSVPKKTRTSLWGLIRCLVDRMIVTRNSRCSFCSFVDTC